MSVEEIMSEIREHGFNVTFSGGDPLYRMPALLELAEALRREGYKLWCYTGFLYEEVLASPEMSPLLPYLDVLVDGPFRENLRDLSLLFRGSANQRLIDVGRSLQTGKTVLWEPDF